VFYELKGNTYNKEKENVGNVRGANLEPLHMGHGRPKGPTAKELEFKKILDANGNVGGAPMSIFINDVLFTLE